ncbi:LapA family protein [Mucilaginibacter sp.]|uniref:LapA family protein n=1 Tax=Mucilaginibacter sp. TaxID=1882438 RepID=UPI0035BBFFD8
MSVKNILALVIVVLLTVIIMQNTDEVKFTILFSTTYLSKVPVMTAIAVFGFILGFLVGRPKNKKYDIAQHHEDIYGKNDSKTLSDEDRDYIS